jgi:hypothetical protein
VSVTWTDALWAADDLRADFGAGCDAIPARHGGGWGVRAKCGAQEVTGTPGQARLWLEARKAPAGDAHPRSSPAGPGGVTG